MQYKRPENETTYNIFHQQEVNKQVPLLDNNPKREAQLQAEGRLYDQTRYALANKFSRPEVQDPALESLSQDIPDILTGEIFRPKPSTGSEIRPEQKGKPRIESNVSAKSVNPYSAYSIVKPEIQRFEDVEYSKFVYPHHKGEHRDVLFGHGLALEDVPYSPCSSNADSSPPHTTCPSIKKCPHRPKSTLSTNPTTPYPPKNSITIPYCPSYLALREEPSATGACSG